MIANFRNEFADPKSLILHAGEIVETGVNRFLAHLLAMTVSSARTHLLQDNVDGERVVARLALVDQRPKG